MTAKRTPNSPLPATASETLLAAPPATLRTIWNTRCGGYPASDLMALSASGAKSGSGTAKKTGRARAKAI